MDYTDIVKARYESTRTRAGRAYVALAAQAYTIETQGAAVERALLAADVPMDAWCAWHALATVSGTLNRCACAPCQRTR